MTAEEQRIAANKMSDGYLEEWGPYMSDRQWGTVREDYSENGDAWNYFPFEHATYRTYRWGEDGIAGLCDLFQNLCFSFSFWNGKDPILKERLFGLGNTQGNHGEDVKELYYYLDNIPTHYYMKFLYKYPQNEFPYQLLTDENKKRTALDPEFEILDTGIFNDNAYFDLIITYAKYGKRDIGIRLEIINRNKIASEITIAPTVWFYNRWNYNKAYPKPSIHPVNNHAVCCEHTKLGKYYLYFPEPETKYFTENETNFAKIFPDRINTSEYTKDDINNAIVHQEGLDKLKGKKSGTKFAPIYKLNVKPGSKKTLYLRLSDTWMNEPFENGFEYIFQLRRKEADEFYNKIISAQTPKDLKNIQRQAFAGLLWSKQYYHYDLERWITTSDGITPISEERKHGRNANWKHLKNQDIILMPDKWEYPWYAAWDLAFHCIAVARVDPGLAKHQLELIMREWYMKPDGQLPAYEWSFDDVNPPLQAWSALEVYHIEKRKEGKGDILFLKRIFQKLIINFTWWINRKDPSGNNIFEGGFLGLDNIGVINRNMTHIGDLELQQADGTSWMGMYALNMMDIALEIALSDPSFEDMGTKFFEHFVYIAEALNELGMWNEEDQFYYDTLAQKGSKNIVQMKILSIVGLTTMFAGSLIQKSSLSTLKDFNKRINWFEAYRKKNGLFWPNEEKQGSETILLSLVPRQRLESLLQKLLDEKHFLATGGIRALSKYHLNHPYRLTLQDTVYELKYDPGDSTSDFFGGNSNWRGPIWLPINYLLINSIRKYGRFYGNSFTIEYPTGSNRKITLEEVADELTRRVISVFAKDQNGNRSYVGKEYEWFYQKPENEDLLQFYEFFHGDNSRGLGASHQTGWTALIAELIDQVKAKYPTPE